MTATARKQSRRTRAVERITHVSKNTLRAQFPAWASVLFSKHRYKVIYGGRGASRSWSVARALLIRAAQKQTRILCTREFQSSLRDSVHQLLRDQIDILKLPGFHATDREIRHANGSLFLFEGLRNNVTKIKSLEGVDICWVEEAERITSESWNVLIPTIRKDGSEIWVTFNPDQEDDSTYQRFVIRQPRDCVSLHVNHDDNPWFPDVLREEMEFAYETDPEAADHIWKGALRKVSDAQILRGKWRIEEFTVPYKAREDGVLEPQWEGPYQGEDFGFAADPFAAVRCWVHDRSLYIEYEVFKLHLELDHIVGAVEEVVPSWAKFVTRADSARPDSISYLKRHGMPRVEPATKGPNSVEDGIAHLRAYRAIIIHPRCKHTADEAKRWSYKVDPRSGLVLPIPVDAHNHIMDSLRYSLEPLMKPQRTAGFIFANGEQRAVCPKCHSFLPDDGECPHCGWIDLDAAIARSAGTPPDEDIVADDAAFDADETRASMDTIRERVHTVTTGNGNGNGNGHGPKNTHLLGINKR